MSNDTNDQASDKSTDTQMSNKKCSKIPTINDTEISIDNQSIPTKGDITINNDETSNGQLIGVRKVQHEEYLKEKVPRGECDNKWNKQMANRNHLNCIRFNL